jgi:hypothetical protein
MDPPVLVNENPTTTLSRPFCVILKKYTDVYSGMHERNIIPRRGSMIFSSPELKAQVSFSDRPLSGVRLSVCPSVNFCIFDFFRTTGPILTRLGTNHPWVKGIQVCSKEGDNPSPREIIAKE